MFYQHIKFQKTSINELMYSNNLNLVNLLFNPNEQIFVFTQKILRKKEYLYSQNLYLSPLFRKVIFHIFRKLTIQNLFLSHPLGDLGDRYLNCSFAQLSFSETVRLKINFSALESGSKLK